MRGTRAKKLRAAARVFMSRAVPGPVIGIERRVVKRTKVEVPSVFNFLGKKMYREILSYSWIWPAGSFRRAYQNIKRAYKRGHFVSLKAAR